MTTKPGTDNSRSATAWQYARRIVAERDTNGPAEDTIKAAVDDLLDRASPPPGTKPPKKTAKARRVAAQT
jgi:putative transposase